MDEKWSHARCMKHWICDSLHEDYIEGRERSEIVVEQITTAFPNREISILELGCNLGRNLHYLLKAGYTQLFGIDVSPRTAGWIRQTFPDLANIMTFYEGSIEDRIVEFVDGRFDVVFSLAVLEHIHPDSEWVFEHIARIANKGIITVEDEVAHSVRMWPRGYRSIFEDLGWKETAAFNCAGVPVLTDTYWARRFEKE